MIELRKLSPGAVFEQRGGAEKMAAVKFEYLGCKAFRNEILYLYRVPGKSHCWGTDKGDLLVNEVKPELKFA
ncbi:MAG: hypothetical protein LBN27_05170 [Prevotellaceae bacterium]|jgi:hypothetical protein|nr:hypothetical protein [Prevotellaceae bacterium]